MFEIAVQIRFARSVGFLSRASVALRFRASVFSRGAVSFQIWSQGLRVGGFGLGDYE